MQEEEKIHDTTPFVPIGVIHSPFTDTSGMPIQPERRTGIKGTVEIFGEYAEGLMDIDGFSHYYLCSTFVISEDP